MKRNYLKPACKAVKIKTPQILAGSDPNSLPIFGSDDDPVIDNEDDILSKKFKGWEDSGE